MKVSLIIIGYNTLCSLKVLLNSINKLKYRNPCEVIYVDDGSSDFSYEFFNDFELRFDKKSFSFSKNVGRVFARRKGISLSSGKWLFFIQSNVVLNSNILNEYLIAIKQNNVLAIGGKVIYQSKDKVFENYLNNKKRGVNKYKLYSKMNYQNLLFLNCMVKRSVFSQVNFDLSFTSYGGKELDFAYRLNLVYPKSIIACHKAVVVRANYPEFKKHCLRQYEYGLKNFNLLSLNLKREVLHFPFLLNNFFVFRWLSAVFYQLCIGLYKIKIYPLSHLFIKGGSLCAILCGYYKSRLLRISQN